MGTINDLFKSVSRVNIIEVVERSIKGNEMVLINYNQQQLYLSSTNADGGKLRLYRSVIYALEKNRRNPSPGMMHPDLYDTGAFYRGFYLTVGRGEYELDSRDDKSPELKKKYGDTIFGLTDENKAEFTQNEFFRTLSRILESQTGLKFT